MEYDTCLAEEDVDVDVLVEQCSVRIGKLM